VSASILSAIGKAIAEHAPEAFGAIAETLLAQGIDLGPMTPDARKDFGAVDTELDAQLAAAASDTDPAPPPKPSER
jgi:hypothetical protein